MRAATIIAFISCCCFLKSQSIKFSGVFETRKKNVPVEIINNHENYFYVMRYNKVAHDITFERRRKPDAAILSFTPLKLDSVNSSVFDYEKLERLCFEIDHKLYFVFEKELNAKSTIYLKIIDTTSKSSGFIELASVEREEGVVDQEFSFSLTPNNSILICGTLSYNNGTTRKALILYDPLIRKAIWTKKLPVENSLTDITESFTVNRNNDLLYTHLKVKSYTMLRAENNSETRIINRFGSIEIKKSFSDSKEYLSHKIDQDSVIAVYSHTLIPQGDSIMFCGQLVCDKRREYKTYLYTERLNHLHEKNRSAVNVIPEKENEKLTFYDGTNYKSPAYKNYRLMAVFEAKGQINYITERKEGIYYNEILNWRLNPITGELNSLTITPRRVVIFAGDSRFKRYGEAMLSLKKDSLYIYTCENRNNFGMNNETFKFHSMDKQSGPGGNIVSFRYSYSGASVKKLVYNNKDFLLVPLIYSGKNSSDDVFYFNKGKKEKFGLLFN